MQQYNKKLLNIDKNAKTVKGQKKGFLTAILYLAPHTESGFNTCPMSSDGCRKSCIFYAGNARFPVVNRGRIKKTKYFYNDRDLFMAQLIQEINNFIINAKKRDLTPCLRLNGTSDINWENIRHNKKSIFETFPDLICYDYTKIPLRMYKFLNGKDWPSNYSLTFSLNEINARASNKVLKMGGNVSAVFRDKLPGTYKGYTVFNADDNDLRFLDPKNTIAGLIYKKPLANAKLAKNDNSGFIIDI